MTGSTFTPTVSTTSVSPSYQPIASPIGVGMTLSGCFEFMRMWRT